MTPLWFWEEIEQARSCWVQDLEYPGVWYRVMPLRGWGRL